MLGVLSLRASEIRIIRSFNRNYQIYLEYKKTVWMIDHCATKNFQICLEFFSKKLSVITVSPKTCHNLSSKKHQDPRALQNRGGPRRSKALRNAFFFNERILWVRFVYIICFWMKCFVRLGWKHLSFFLNIDKMISVFFWTPSITKQKRWMLLGWNDITCSEIGSSNLGVYSYLHCSRSFFWCL